MLPESYYQRDEASYKVCGTVKFECLQDEDFVEYALYVDGTFDGEFSGYYAVEAVEADVTDEVIKYVDEEVNSIIDCNIELLTRD